MAPDLIDLLSSYLSIRAQQFRLGLHTSTWEKILKGVPQGLILGTLIFNVFLKELFKTVLLTTRCLLYMPT